MFIHLVEHLKKPEKSQHVRSVHLNELYIVHEYKLV